MNVKQMRRMVESLQIKEKAKGKMIMMNLNTNEHIDMTHKRPVETKKRMTIAELKEKYKYKFRKSENTRKFMPSSPKTMKSKFPRKPIRVSVRSMIEKGQTMQELMAHTMAMTSDRHSKLIAWKYDEDFIGFILKRINGSCEVVTYLLIF